MRLDEGGVIIGGSKGGGRVGGGMGLQWGGLIGRWANFVLHINRLISFKPESHTPTKDEAPRWSQPRSTIINAVQLVSVVGGGYNRLVPHQVII